MRSFVFLLLGTCITCCAMKLDDVQLDKGVTTGAKDLSVLSLATCDLSRTYFTKDSQDSSLVRDVAPLIDCYIQYDFIENIFNSHDQANQEHCFLKNVMADPKMERALDECSYQLVQNAFNQRNYNKETLSGFLHCCLFNYDNKKEKWPGNYEQLIKNTLRLGASPNVCTREGLSFLHLSHHVSLIQIFLDAKAHINKQNVMGETPLIIHARHLRKDIIELLLHCGADHAIRNVHGETALDIVNSLVLVAPSDDREHITYILAQHKKND